MLVFCFSFLFFFFRVVKAGMVFPVQAKGAQYGAMGEAGGQVRARVRGRCGRGEALPRRVCGAARSPLPAPTSPRAGCACTYHHEELTSGVSRVKSRGSQSQIPPRGAFILTPLRPHQVRLRVRAPCVPPAEALSRERLVTAAGASPRPRPLLASAASGETR